ncbi:MAG TPA: 3-hydroxybutyryl-CoA dehydrogenase [Flavobacteriales bacterium]|nr:3-hydroxybutyryl-CoA dehydrogenase [Flavobacteriales bacterium]
MTIGVLGAGSMGSGIAQVAASNGHKVLIYENNESAAQKAKAGLEKILGRLVEKTNISEAEKSEIIARIKYVSGLNEMAECGLIIEAIIENLDVKKTVFSTLEEIVGDSCILASNTSSLSIASIGSACKKAERVVGIHFFNPAPLMPLVEIIPSLNTSGEVLENARVIIDSWGKKTVVVKDTPGFIVNRLARPFYGEAIRIYEEGLADMPTIDQAMKDKGFKMGPFELMDYIGNDINYTVTETVFREFFYDPRYKPSFTQKRMMESGRLGRKSGKGYYDYSENAVNPKPLEDEGLKKMIFDRIICLLINEAADALYLNIASKEDLETAMIKGVNYPKGLLAWADELGVSHVYSTLKNLQEGYGEDRYRPSILLKKMADQGSAFYN